MGDLYPTLFRGGKYRKMIAMGIGCLICYCVGLTMVTRVRKTCCFLSQYVSYSNLESGLCQKSVVQIKKMKSSLYTRYYSASVYEWWPVGSISATWRPGCTRSFEETSQRWQAAGDTTSDLTSPRTQLKTSRADGVATAPAF